MTQEKFDIVVTKIINEENWRLPYTVNEFGGKVLPGGYVYQEGWRNHYAGTVRTFEYSSLKEFYTRNPNCCELVEVLIGGERLKVTIPFEERVCGRLNTLVRVFYIYDYDARNNNLPLYAERYFGLSNCGDLWTDDEVIELHNPGIFWN